jgi:hypothetical protein
MRVASSPEIEFDLVATPTPTQRRVFALLGVPVPAPACTQKQTSMLPQTVSMAVLDKPLGG